jgi:SAM-dependent methyltransferase
MDNYVDTYSDPSVYETGRHEFDDEILTMPFQPGNTLIEIGCGNGRFLKKLQAKYPTLKISGLDSSQTGIDACRQVLDGNFICGDITRYEISDKYDYVLCFNTLEHFRNPNLVMRKLKELCHNASILYLTVPNADLDLCDDHMCFWNQEQFKAFAFNYFPRLHCFPFDQNQNLFLKAWNI